MKYVLWVLLAIVFCSCGADYDIIANDDVDFIIVSKSTGATSYGSPYARIVIENAGDRIGYNVSCTVQVTRGGIIVDSGFAYFAGGEDIEPGERAEERAIFFGLSSLIGCTLKYRLSWLER